MQLSLFGFFLCVCGGFMFLHNNDAMCALRVWLLALGLAITYPCLTLKQFRLWVIFRRTAQGHRTSKNMTNFHFFLWVGAVCMPTVIVLVTCFAISPYIRARDVINYDDRTIGYFCGSPDETVSTVLLSILLAFNFIVLLFGVFVSVRST